MTFRFITDDEISCSSEIRDGINATITDTSLTASRKELYEEMSIIDNKCSFLSPFYSEFERHNTVADGNEPNTIDDCSISTETNDQKCLDFFLKNF